VSKSISLDDLVALNDEIAGLVRAGVPLELGLASWGGDLPGQLGAVVTRLAASVERGQSLPQSLAEHSTQIPPLYAAIVSAGLKSGRLPAALESLATSARNLKEVRGAIGLAVLYPLILVLVGYSLFVLLLTQVIPTLVNTYEATPPRFWSLLADLGTTAAATVPIPGTDRVIFVAVLPPLALLLAAAICWLGTRRAMVLDMGSAGRWLGWVPLAGRVARQARAASLAEIVGLLVEHDVPLDEAIVLAAECTGDRKLVRSTRKLAASIEKGAMPRENWKQLDGFPPLLAWLMSSGGRQQTFTAMARHVADTYRRRAMRDAQWLRDYLPMWLTLMVGGSLVALFGVALFLPYSQLMEALSVAVGHSMRIKP
jgi:type II secretory pathway component PulF